MDYWTNPAKAYIATFIFALLWNYTFAGVFASSHLGLSVFVVTNNNPDFFALWPPDALSDYIFYF